MANGSCVAEGAAEGEALGVSDGDGDDAIEPEGDGSGDAPPPSRPQWSAAANTRTAAAQTPAAAHAPVLLSRIPPMARR